MKELSALLVALLALIGPAPKDTPAELQLKAGDEIVAIGDSITAMGGYLRDIDAVMAAQYPELKLPPIINVGISGQHAEDLVARFKKDVIDKKPAVVTLSIGINDVWHRLNAPHDEKVLAAYSANIAKLVDMAQAAGIKVILLSPTILTQNPDSEGNKRLLAYVAAEKQIAADKKCGFADLHDLFLTALKNSRAEKDPPDFLRDDAHMNARGDALMAIGALCALGVPDAKIKIDEAKP